MTRALTILLASLALVLAACGGDDEGAAPTTTGGGEALKVALITDAGQLNDRGFNQLAYEGLQRAERELGIEGRVVESRTASDYVPNMTTLARQGFDVIIGVGFAQGDAVATASKTFPDKKFVIIDVDQAGLKGKPANVVGMLFREEQVGYLAG
ncbi:MAG: BMP family ABC transporter substrate-binding protein [Actinobacteria bacterium]|nr:BMP family ABC transporter substrate-binding protein [Actinomycetota bacterium]